MNGGDVKKRDLRAGDCSTPTVMQFKNVAA